MFLKLCILLVNVSGRDCILVDDMIDTGGTLVKAAEALKERGATKVVAYATHAVLLSFFSKKMEGIMAKFFSCIGTKM